MKTETFTLPALLHAGGAVAIRKLNAATDIDAMAGSILAKGIMQPLIGRTRGETIEITDGNRRLAAVRLLIERGELAEDFAIRVDLREEDDNAALETAIHANTQRVEMHPLDEADAFAALIESGMNAETVAARNGVTVRRVEQRMALVRLAPQVREAYRANKITLDLARAFSQGDEKQQADVFKAASRDRFSYTTPESIRRAFRRGDIPTSAPIFLAVGASAYEAAGGAYRADLFEDYRAATDADLVQRLFEDRKAEARAAFVAEGWAEAHYKGDCEYWRWTRAPAQLEDDDATFRARCRFTFEIDPQTGGFVQHSIYTLPAEKNSATDGETGPSVDETGANGGNADAPEYFRMDHQVQRDMNGAVHAGMRDRLAGDVILAKRFAVASMALELAEAQFDNPLDLSPSIRFDVLHPVAQAFIDGLAGDTFAAALDATAGVDDLDGLLAALIASTLNIGARDIADPSDDVRPVLAALDLDPGTLYRPDAAYFEQFPKADLLGFLGEMKPAAVSRVKAKGKDQVIAACVREAEKSGWIAPALRLPALPAEPVEESEDETAPRCTETPDMIEGEDAPDAPDAPAEAGERPFADPVGEDAAPVETPDSAPSLPDHDTGQEWTMPEGESLAA